MPKLKLLKLEALSRGTYIQKFIPVVGTHLHIGMYQISNIKLTGFCDD
ncbi:hypothetical protein VCHA50P417_80066 [Vibrio chagasii]|nr:hypothetical protein VCHA35O142_10934 [Vibrio chagasii]CAH7001034.1 hypothetical protein VCHA54P489_170072 [Vibrio chagasii]CAH7035229.1 hypothetical protein VCHA37P202_160072 [Vibrio chagasii]CAH7048905.1 hypothetical protein VCHA49P380_180076 [Vibrio chagasii]CAH7398948.1 hypothetical protein VCHA50P417_80066 [Vibrio chagasii]